MGNRDDFEVLVVPHLDAAYNLARWLLRDERTAEDAVQEAALRAFRYIASCKRDNAKAWLLGIVRNACFDAMQRSRRRNEVTGLEDDELDLLQDPHEHGRDDPHALLEDNRERDRIDAAIQSLPAPLREVIVLRELEDLDYAEIARVTSVPIGTVMSRLSRARGRLRELLKPADVGE